MREVTIQYQSHLLTVSNDGVKSMSNSEGLNWESEGIETDDM